MTFVIKSPPSRPLIGQQQIEAQQLSHFAAATTTGQVAIVCVRGGLLGNGDAIADGSLALDISMIEISSASVVSSFALPVAVSSFAYLPSDALHTERGEVSSMCFFGAHGDNGDGGRVA